MTSQIKYRNMWVQVLLFIVTFGIYGIYWFYQVSRELVDATGDVNASPALWTVLLFVPFANIWSIYKLCEVYERWSPDRFNKWLMFVLYLVIVPAAWFIIQTELNRKATYGR